MSDSHTFFCPPNKWGFVTYHTRSGKPIPDEKLLAFYDKILGPISQEVIKKLNAEMDIEDSALNGTA